MKSFKIVLITLAIIIVVAKILILFTEERKLYRPDDMVFLTPRNVEIPYEDIYFNTKDHQSLNGWFVPSKGAKITILYCQGRSSNLSDTVPFIKFFHEMGLNVFAFDYRGFGNSSGKPSEQGLYKDVEAAYDYLITRKDIDKDKIVVYGKSLGGPVATHLCLKRKLAALILEGCFPSLKTYVGDIGGFLPTEWLVSEKFDAVSRVKKIKIPKLIVHGMDDEVISFSEGRLLYNKAALPKEFLSFNGGHDDNIYLTSEAYKDKLEEFFQDYKIS
ncbi:MAG: alpha/beta hydrolase [Candidatus Omnitrophota bacterium]|jgi:hypothetical protein